MSTIIRARAPLRLGLAGGGTDVSPFCDIYGGAVLNVTIDRYALASITRLSSDEVIFRSTDLGKEERLPLLSSYNTAEGLRLHRGVYNRLIRDFNGGVPIPLCLTTHVESPMGSGLGSSSALVVAMVEALRELLRAPLGEYDIARLAFDIERNDVGLNGGRQDQYSAAFGGFNFIEFAKDEHVLVNPLRIHSSYSNELQASLVLFFTGVSRESATIIENQTASLSTGGIPLEGMHQLKADAIAMKEQLLRGNIQGVAEVLTHSWAAKKKTSSAVSTPKIERIYELAMKSGALAGKVSGAGGGGFMMFIVDPERRAEVITRLSAEGEGHVQTCGFTDTGVTAWRTQRPG
jgi:D-glycero-alpha-D-manno-heptose-7-phosphate kinase